jgi:hypothetical protein
MSVPVAWVAVVLAGVVAVLEFVYYLSHPQRSGPALQIAVLAVAVALLGISSVTGSSGRR